MERFARHLVDLAVRYVDPDAVLLFGSVAQGRARADSDVDLLVVGPFSGLPERRGLEFRQAISDYPVPVDALFYTPAEFGEQASRSGSFVQSVSRHGSLAYVRPGFDTSVLWPAGRMAWAGRGA